MPASSLCPPQPLGSSVPLVTPPAPGGCYRGAALPPPTALGRDRSGPRPGQAQKPRGDARGEPPRCRPRRRLGPAGSPPWQRRRWPPGYRSVFGRGAGWLSRSARAKRRALPQPPSGGHGGRRRRGQRSSQPRCRPGVLTARGWARKVPPGCVRADCFALLFQRMLKCSRSVAGL